MCLLVCLRSLEATSSPGWGLRLHQESPPHINLTTRLVTIHSSTACGYVKLGLLAHLPDKETRAQVAWPSDLLPRVESESTPVLGPRPLLFLPDRAGCLLAQLGSSRRLPVPRTGSPSRTPPGKVAPSCGCHTPGRCHFHPPQPACSGKHSCPSSARPWPASAGQ